MQDFFGMALSKECFGFSQPKHPASAGVRLVAGGTPALLGEAHSMVQVAGADLVPNFTIEVTVLGPPAPGSLNQKKQSCKDGN